MDLSVESDSRVSPKVVWSDAYRGHRIATLRDSRIWLLLVDDVVAGNGEFETTEEAAAWLRRKVDANIAESIFPGLAGV